MMLHIALVAEILATILCIHCIYGRKVTLDVKTVGTILVILTILEIINFYNLGGLFSASIYVVLFIYCKSEFKSSTVETIISILIYIIILASIQFVCIAFMNIVIRENQLARNAIGNLFILVMCVTILPKCGLDRLRDGLNRKNGYIMILLGFMILTITVMLLQEKVFYKIQILQFILVIPAIFLLLYTILKLYMAHTENERMEQELGIMAKTSGEYEKLLTRVRLRQHELKNHIAAVFSTHYTYKTYEKLVQAQEEYCKKILNENRYNNLLLLGNNILVGYLYGKIQEAEDDGITVTYQVSAKIDEMSVPIYYVIEMLGILFDNAVDALRFLAKKEIFLEISESSSEYEFSIRNPYHYVRYDEISEWFELGKSEKGSGRGLGLYHLKCLCEEWHSDIQCRNIEIEQNNWILFTLKIKKGR